ncbi:cystathionine beta-synthase-like protein isoform X1 [Clavelina lepadiformis]|uniref:cystathionine beta-synthase-like protein isoform X1 n=1 Tax=Clavelina lepadiformis TaxID=159417 RepID=UPI004042C0D9
MSGKCPISGNGAGDADSWIRPDQPPKCTWDASGSKPSPHFVYRPVRDRKTTFATVLEAIGDTPLVRLSKIEKEYGLKCQLFGKCEFFNAGGSVKDRIGLRMVEDAEREGIIKPGYTIIEPTSGNTGIGLALASAVKGYRCIIVMPEKMSMEKVNVLKALGAEIVRTPTSARFDAPESHIRVAQKLQREITNAVILDQYRNPGNPLAHYDTTAEEILEQCGGQVDMVVGGAGTGGTITGIGKKFKEKCPKCRVIAVDPEGSDLALPEELNKTDTTYYEIEGIGYDFIPTVLDRSVVDKWYKSNDKESLIMARKLIRMEGLLCGGSSGTAAYIAAEAAKELKEGQKCVCILPDSIRNYMTKHLMEEWMMERDFIPCTDKDDKWWSKLTISDMKLQAPVAIMPETKCEEALKIMETHNFDQLPVINKDGKMVGTVTVGSLTSSFSADKVKLTDPVSMCLYSKFKKMKVGDKLTTLSKVLETDHFVVVLGSKVQYNLVEPDSLTLSEMRIDGGAPDSVCGIITPVDFLHFISSKH